MPDSWEDTNGLDKDDSTDGALDDDGDGQKNLAEFLAGTNPQSAASRLAITAFTRNTGTVALSWLSVPGKSYIIQACDDLTDWQTHESSPGVPLVIPASAGAETSQEIPVPSPGTDPKRFFRIAVAAQN